MEKKHSFIGYGNPLLDISAVVPQSFLDKYGLKNSNAILAAPEHYPLYKELVRTFECEFIPGGSSQNTTRAVQWLVKEPHACGFVGSVGKVGDRWRVKMEEALKKGGLDPLFHTFDGIPTGTCAVLLMEKDRSLVANLAASEKYSLDHTKSPQIQERLEKCKMMFMESFFLSHSPETAAYIAEYTTKHDQIFGLSFSATFLITLFLDRMMRLIPHTDIIFANEDEGAAFGKSQGWPNDLKEIALRLSNLPLEKEGRKRAVIFTQGSEPTIIAFDNEVISQDVIVVPSESIKDLNGAGDSFAGGVLAQILEERLLPGGSNALNMDQLKRACKRGNLCASDVIQQSGATFPDTNPPPLVE